MKFICLAICLWSHRRCSSIIAPNLLLYCRSLCSRSVLFALCYFQRWRQVFPSKMKVWTCSLRCTIAITVIESSFQLVLICCCWCCFCLIQKNSSFVFSFFLSSISVWLLICAVYECDDECFSYILRYKCGADVTAAEASPSTMPKICWSIALNSEPSECEYECACAWFQWISDECMYVYVSVCVWNVFNKQAKCESERLEIEIVREPVLSIQLSVVWKRNGSVLIKYTR